VNVSFLKEDIGLVHEEDRTPSNGVVEDFIKALLYLFRFGTKLAAANSV